MIKAAADVRVEDVTVVGDVATAPGPYGDRMVTMRAQDGLWSAYEGTSGAERSIAGPVNSRDAIVTLVFAVLASGDAAVPSSDAAWRVRQRKDAAAAATNEARWQKVLCSGEPENPER